MFPTCVLVFTEDKQVVSQRASHHPKVASCCSSSPSSTEVPHHHLLEVAVAVLVFSCSTSIPVLVMQSPHGKLPDARHPDGQSWSRSDLPGAQLSGRRCQPNPFSNLLASLLMHRDKNSHREMTPEGEVAHIDQWSSHNITVDVMDGRTQVLAPTMYSKRDSDDPCAYTAEKVLFGFLHSFLDQPPISYVLRGMKR